MYNTSVTTQQPLPVGQIYGHIPPRELFSSGPVSVRNATESTEDREFFGRVVIEGFERNFTHATSRARYNIRYYVILVITNFIGHHIVPVLRMILPSTFIMYKKIYINNVLLF